MGEKKMASHKKPLRSLVTPYTRMKEPKKVASPASLPSPSINCPQNLIYHWGAILPNAQRLLQLHRKSCFTIEAEAEAILGGARALPNKPVISMKPEPFLKKSIFFLFFLAEIPPEMTIDNKKKVQLINFQIIQENNVSDICIQGRNISK